MLHLTLQSYYQPDMLNNLPIIPQRFIAIEGNIGSGKTTLAEMIGKDYECRVILEQFADNPFLPYFYEDKERYGFPLELFFMTERYKQLQALGSQTDLFLPFMVSDYAFIKTLLFAKNHLPDGEYRILQKLWLTLEQSVPAPELIIYLHRPIPVLLQNIYKRGRSYEFQIQQDYLRTIQDGYFEYFRTELNIPVLVVDMQDVNLLQHPEYYREILSLMGQQYNPGLHHIRIHSSVNK